MARFAVRRVRYEGDAYSYASPQLPDGMCILVGANGTGKTTFSDFIYFGLGGRVPKYDRKGDGRHVEITGDTNNYVELEIEINDEHFRLRRHIGRGEIGVIGNDGTPSVLHVFRQHAIGEQGVFSDWLLAKLDIRPVTLHQGNRSWTLGFRDLARLLYHDQEPNPGHVFRRPDQDGITESSYVRRAIFEVLTGRSFQDLYNLQGEVRKLEEDIASLTSQTKSFEHAVQLFLEPAAGQNTDHLQTIAEDLTREYRSLQEERGLYITQDPIEAEIYDSADEYKMRLSEASERHSTVKKTREHLITA